MGIFQSNLNNITEEKNYQKTVGFKDINYFCAPWCHSLQSGFFWFCRLRALYSPLC